MYKERNESKVEIIRWDREKCRKKTKKDKKKEDRIKWMRKRGKRGNTERETEE